MIDSVETMVEQELKQNSECRMYLNGVHLLKSPWKALLRVEKPLKSPFKGFSTGTHHL